MSEPRSALAALLHEAAQVLPGRFRAAAFPWAGHTCHSWQVHRHGEWEPLWVEKAENPWNPIWDQELEAACREEGAARGWLFSLQGNGPDHTWLVIGRTVHGRRLSHAEAPSPVEALLLALLRAVRSER